MRILIASGGTGGHLFPAIRLAEEIKLRSIGEILFITSCRRPDRDILKNKDIKFTTLPVVPLQSKSPVAILNFAVRLATGTIKSLFLLFQFRPFVAIGFGGYISGPILLLAALLRVRTVIHEQNVYPGKTNRILARFVDKITVSFPETVDYLEKFRSKIILSGNPLRRELERTRNTKGTFTILAMGGSQGSGFLNRLIPEALGLLHEGKKNILEVVHISGYDSQAGVEKAYQDKGITNRVFSFTEDIAKLYSECDFVISRAGAMTVSELLFLAKPSILIPYPYAGGHQRLNAKVLEKMGIGVLLESQGLTAEALRDAVVGFMDKGRLIAISEKAKYNITRDACDILIKELLVLDGHG